MNIDDWFQWPTKSSDPGVNFVAIIVVAFFAAAAVIAVVAGAIFLVPLLIIFAIAKGIHWHLNRPMPTDQLAASAQQRTIAANFPETKAFLDMHIDRLWETFEGREPTYNFALELVDVSKQLYETESLNNPLPPIPPANTIEEGRYRDRLLAQQKKAADAPKTLEVFNSTISRSYLNFIATLPPIAMAGDTGADTVHAQCTLLDLIPDAGKAVFALMHPFYADDAEQLGLFTGLRRQLERNSYEASGARYPTPPREFVMPDEHKGSPREIVTVYLHDTPLEQLFYAPIPFAFADEQRFEHMHVIGGSGHGKTQLLQHLILTDLQRENSPSLIVIDSQGEMLRKIQELKIFAEQPDRLIIIDPEQYSPALNMFDTTNRRAAGYSELHREQLQAGVIELYNYIFASIAAEMTSRQGTAFAFVARLMLSIPGATIHTLRELMEDPAPSIEQSPFREYIDKLEPTARAYFQNQFFTKRYSDLKQQIARRLYGVLSVPAFDRMFSASSNKLDMFEAMQSGKVILVNTSKSLLKSDASALFGRYMIALVIRAVYERVASPNRHPAFLFVDEASEYFDDNIQMLLEQARKFKVGLVLAHQHLDQLSTSLRSAIAANTAIKLAGGVNDRDARALAPDMRTNADFIAGMRKQPSSTQFACYVRNFTGKAVALDIPFGTLEAAPTMTEQEHKRLIDRNRVQYAADLDPPRPVATSPEPAPPAAPAPASPAEPQAAPPPADDWRS